MREKKDEKTLYNDNNYAACRLFEMIRKTASDDAATPDDIDTLIAYYAAD